jgi:endonuclease G
MRIYLSIFALIAFSVSVSAQNPFSVEISTQEKQLAELDSKREKILQQLEALRLKRNIYDLKDIGLPLMKDSGTTYFRSAYVFNYNEPAEQSNWVAHIISPEITGGIITRTNDFRTDSLVKTGTATKADYWKLGYDRGHLAPSADFKWSLKALSESYLYSNMTPQNPELNRERWAQLEDMFREYVVEYQRPLYIVTGPILDKGLDSIGPNRVAVPKRFFKVALDYSAKPMRTIGFIMPNEYCKYPVMHYAINVDSVESITKINFFPKLPTSIQAAAEKTYTDSLWLPEKKKNNIAPLRKDQLPKGAVNSVDAKNYANKSVKVCGTIVATKYSEKSGATFLNFDQKFPDQLFYISIWKGDLANFPYQPHVYLLNKEVCVTGTVTLNRDIPTINIKNDKLLEIDD